MGESGGKAAARRGGRPAQAAPATEPHRERAAPQPPEHPGQQLHSRSTGEFVSHPSTNPEMCYRSPSFKISFCII